MRTLSENFFIIQVDLDSDDDPEKIFQTINDTGRKLDDFDYLRNYLFLKTRKGLKGRPSDRLYDLYWDKFEEWDPVKLDRFFRAFLKAKLGPACFEGEGKSVSPFDCYRQNTKVLEGPNQDFILLLQLSRYADSYEELNNPVAKDADIRQLGNRMQFYSDLDIPCLDSFILFLKHATELPDSELLKDHVSGPIDEKSVNEILTSYFGLRQEHAAGLSDEKLCELCDILESYIVRRWFCDGSYKPSYEQINTFFSDKISSKPSVDEFVKFLLKTWPDPNKVTETLEDQASSADPNLVLYVLYRIELMSQGHSFPSKDHTYTPLNLRSKPFMEHLVSATDLLKREVEDAESEISLRDIQRLTDETSRMAKSIGNIKSTTSSRKTSWNVEKIHDRTQALVKDFNEIWKSLKK